MYFFPNIRWIKNIPRLFSSQISLFQVAQAWPGLPAGVKFDPSDQEIIWHLFCKSGHENVKPHPFIDEFIPTVKEDDGICYTHPQNLPGIY